jgi:hypothetical protein
MFLYVVTEYGCNSTPNDMWTPISKIFTDFAEADKYFKDICPEVAGHEIYVNREFRMTNLSHDYIIIENRCQSYDEKRPCGVVIARYGI